MDNLFEAPTVAELAAVRKTACRAKTGLGAPLLVPRSREGTLPLSFAQQRLWFLHHLEPDSPAYNTPLDLRLSGNVDVAALHQSLQALVDRHETLRTCFPAVDGLPSQVIADRLILPFIQHDLRGLSEADRETAAQDLGREEALQPFNLATGPLLRATLLHLTDTESILLVTMHHIISDGGSIGVVSRELAVLYEAFVAQQPSLLPPLPIQYVDFAIWQRQWFTGEVLEQQLAYWREHLADLAPLELPTDRPRPPIQSYSGAKHVLELSHSLREQLQALCRQEGVTLAVTLLAAFQVLLGRYTGQTDFAVGSPIANRNRREIEGLIGFFVNSLVMRTNLSGDPSFHEVLRRVQKVALGAYDHQDLPFERLVEELQPERDLSRNPLFQVAFAVQNAPFEGFTLPGVTVQPFGREVTTTRFDLECHIRERREGLMVELVYNTDLYDQANIARLAHHFQTVLVEVGRDPTQRLSQLPLLSEHERQQMLVEWNATSTAYPREACIHELFEAQVAQTPEAVALVFEEQQLTYHELNTRANQLAHYLRKRGVGPEARVGLCVERSLEMVVGMLGILKAGGAYVPLNPTYPPERQAFMVKDANLTVVLSYDDLRDRLPSDTEQVVALDTESALMSQETTTNPACPLNGNHAAYVIYTSGSTGQPKGVVVTHQAVIRLVVNTDYVQLTSTDRVAQLANAAFDAITFEIWGPLVHGARVVGLRQEVVLAPATLATQVEQEGITIIFLTTALFNQMAREAPTGFSRVRTVLFGGEQVDPRWVQEVLTQAPPKRLLHVYGPTESTTFTTWYSVPMEPNRHGVVPIGRPISNTQVYLLDQQLKPVPVGVPGEVYIGGDGLARNYQHQSALTAEKFVPHPFSAEPGARLFRTGDRARYRADGNIEFLGRVDQQVKLRGYRIELGEIETVLAQHSAVQEAVVLAREDEPGEKRLVAYVVAGQEQLSPSELHRHLKQTLPEYMLPALFVMLDVLPLTPNGKVDRRALPAPDGSRAHLETPFVAPRTPTEQVLARIWKEVLKIEQVGLADDFFDLGGDSIRAMRLVNILQDHMGEVVHPSIIFEARTVAELSRYLSEHYPIASHRLAGEPLSSRVCAKGSATTLNMKAELVKQLRSLMPPLAPRLVPDSVEPNRPAVFVLAPPRSGSSLLRIMLAGHPSLFAPPELELLSFNTLQDRRRACSGRYGFMREGSLRAIMQLKGYSADEAVRIMEGFERQNLTTKAFYRILQDWIGKRTLVDKTTTYGQDLEVLRRAEAYFERPRYIQLLRHPCGMIRSFEEARLDLILRFRHPFSSRELAELLWCLTYENISAFLSEVPPDRQHSVRFEDLVTDPTTVMTEVCDFLGLEFHPNVIDPYKQQNTRMTDGLYAVSRPISDPKFHQHGKIDPQAGDRWKGYVDPCSLSQMTCELASSLGYEIDTPPRTGIETARQGAQLPGVSPLVPCSREGTLPLSFAQQRLWFLHQLDPESPAYNMPLALRLSGNVDIAALHQSLQALVDRHETLRTCFPEVAGHPSQAIADRLVIPFIQRDLRELPEVTREMAAQELAREEALRPFGLATGPVIRTMLLQLADTEYVLLVTMHHIISDGWSRGIFSRELAALYEACITHKPSPLPPLSIQYADFAHWQWQWFTGEVLKQQLVYWREHLADLSPLELPTDHPRPPVQTYHGARHILDLPNSLRSPLQALTREAGVTLAITLLAAFQVLLARYTGQTDIVVGSPIANRTRREIEGLIGFFVNSLVMRTNLSGDPSFHEVLRRVQEVALGAYDHQDLPFERLVEALQPERDQSRNPLFQVMFAVQNAPFESFTLPGVTVQPFDSGTMTTHVDLGCHVWERPEGLRVVLNYNTHLFEADTIARFGRHFQALLEGVVQQPEAPLSQVPILSEQETHQQLVEWNTTAQEFPPEGCLHERIEAQVSRTPEAVAVVYGQEQLTYHELNARANKLAQHLRQHRVGPDTRVGVCMDRSVELVISLLGILKAGGAYVPLDPSYPKERLAFMLADANPVVLLTTSMLGAKLPAYAGKVIALDTAWPEIAKEAATCPCSGVGLEHLAYVLYTSGSTGTPKGVMISHRALRNHLAWVQQAFSFTPGDCVLQKTLVTFDASVWEFFSPLLVGARLVLVGPEEHRDPSVLIHRITEQQVTFLKTVPSLLRQLLESGLPACGSLRYVSCGGEELPIDLVRTWQASATGPLVNLYGPTETTVNVLWWVCGAEEELVVPLGRPNTNTQVYLLDEGQHLVPVGVPGELYIGGSQLARGYLGRPELTAEKFVPHPFSSKPGARLYRSGDRARYRADGRIEFLGRVDHQVKIRGFRIELGEIEAVLAQHPAVQETVVVAREDEPGEKRLVAYVVVSTEGGYSTSELRRFLQGQLPEYMVPSAVVLLDALPLTGPGKVDRRTLPKPEDSQSILVKNFVPPRSPLEKGLAEMWREALRLKQVGVHDNFFDLGGHSLLATQICSRIREQLQVELPLRDFFEAPTVAGLATLVDATPFLGNWDTGTLIPSPEERDQPFPLTDVQQAYWVGKQGIFELGNVATHAYVEFESNDIDLNRLNQAWQRVVERHDMLRAIVLPDGQQKIFQQVAPYTIQVADLRGQSAQDVASTLAAIREEMSGRLRASDQWPLFEIRATLLDGHRMRIHYCFDAIIMDYWSQKIVCREWGHLYEDPSVLLPELHLSFRDYVVAESNSLNSERYTRARSYWLNRLPSPPPAPKLPMVSPPLTPSARDYSRRSKQLGPATWRRLKDLAAERRLTPSVVLLTAFAEILKHWSAEPRFTINLTLFNRLPVHPQINEVVGDFTSLTMLEVNNQSATTFQERARTLQGQLMDDLDHREFSGVKVLRELARQQEDMPGVLMPVVFTSTLGQGSVQESSASAWLGEQVYRRSVTPQVWLDHGVKEEGGSLYLQWAAVDPLFPPGLLDDMFEAYVHLVSSLADDQTAWTAPRSNVTTKHFLPKSQNESQLAVNATHAAIPDGVLHTKFVEHALSHPERVALITEDQVLTYGELLRKSNQVGNTLCELGARPNTLIGVLMEKGWEQVVAVLGILQSGAAYLPIDADLPRERIRYLLEHGQVEIVLTQLCLVDELLLPPHGRMLTMSEETLKGWDDKPLTPQSNPEDIAYVIYTSGSTGQPKGVIIDHRGALNTIVDLNSRFQVGPQDRVLGLSSLSFDLSVYDIFGVLGAGGTLVLPEPEAVRDPSRWAQLVTQHQVTLWNSVPALLELFVEYVEEHQKFTPLPLRVVYLSGDWIPVGLPDRIRRVGKDLSVISMGGATEASIWSIIYPIGEVDPAWTSIPYGKPMNNQQFYVLNEELNPCPMWVPGQLYIGGVGLAKGYWRDEEKTSASFFQHPRTGERLYATGDRGRYLPDGNIEFLGRQDCQVKIQGYRVELGEIETTLEQHPTVRSAVVSVKAQSPGPKRLLAYLVAERGDTLSCDALRAFTKEKLPEYMVPSTFMELEALPLSGNGKVDRQALPDPPDSSREPNGDASKAQPDLTRQMSHLVAQVLKLERVDATENLLSLGATSVDMIRIATRVEKEFAFRPGIIDMYRTPTVNGLLALLPAKTPSVQGGEAGITGLIDPDMASRLSSYARIDDPNEREAFKAHRPGIRQVREPSSILSLNGRGQERLDITPYVTRRSYRTFLEQPLSKETVSRWLECVRGLRIQGHWKYRYGSAGGLYPVQTYVYVKPTRVQGLEEGYYYYHPLEHQLVKLAPAAPLTQEVYGPLVNGPIFEQAAFGVFLVAQFDAIGPLYGAASLRLVTLEAGLMTQLFETEAPAQGIGLTQIGGIAEELVRKGFALESSHYIVHSLLGGGILQQGKKERQGRADEATVRDVLSGKWVQGEL